MMDRWMIETGQYIKSVDSKHMVTWGGEGEFYEPGNADWAYAGADGGNFLKELAIDAMDFGTFHLYPDWWSKTAAWANQWYVLGKLNISNSRLFREKLLLKHVSRRDDGL
jgi:mannan endo-1,4-beta-mannosidase